MAGKMKIKLLKRSLIQRYGSAILTVSESDAARMIKQGHAIAVDTGFDKPPINKMMDAPVAKKEVSSPENPTKEEEKIDYQEQNGKPRLNIRIKK